MEGDSSDLYSFMSVIGTEVLSSYSGNVYQCTQDHIQSNFLCIKGVIYYCGSAKIFEDDLVLQSCPEISEDIQKVF